MHTHSRLFLAVMLAFTGTLAHAQNTKSGNKPPVAQAWIDVATFSGMAMPGMGGGGNPMAMLGSLFGGGGGRNSFGNTVAGPEGQWLDVTLMTRANPKLDEATQAMPAGSKLAPELRLVSPRQQKAPPPDTDDEVVKEDFERPKGKIYLYWGCGDSIRSGQPKVLDMSKASMQDIQKFFVSRRATQHGTHLAAGRPVWPNEDDARVVPDGASLVGDHRFKGQGVPESFKFNLGAGQDFMPRIRLAQRETNGVTRLEWPGMPTARAFFLSAMGAREGGGEHEMVFWTSSEVPEIGTGLVDYQTNAAVDRWLGEHVLLPASTRGCSVPKGVFGEGAMLRMIAYGNELNLAHPPRPANPKQPWEPEWAAKVRVKSVATAMLGMEAMAGKGGRGGTREDTGGRDFSSGSSSGAASVATDPVGTGLNKLKGLFGF
jgi:hypothetical protein